MLGVSSNECVSPASSVSPPPAPPPQPPAMRQYGGCIRCRFNNTTTTTTPTTGGTHQRTSIHNQQNYPYCHHQYHHHHLHYPYHMQHNHHDNNHHLHTVVLNGQTGATAVRGVNYGTSGNNNYSGYGGCGRLADEEDSACPALLEREFHSLHRNVPGLRRAGVDTNAIRQHFYPDGGWGWIVCGVAFLAHVLTTGFQLSYGLLLIYAMHHLGHEFATETAWLGAASWAMSMLTAPIIIALCRRKSTRLTAVLGGLVLSLGILFASFATLLHQVAFSYGIVVGVGAAMVRESSCVMLGHYFKRRRQFVEMITMSGEGVGIGLFSVILVQGVGKIGWRLGLQAITGFISLSFFMGLLYRPASLYHPQRRAILHLKNQRKKVKEKKTHIRTPKPPFLDFSPFKSSTVRMLLISSGIASFGAYAPIFFMSLHGYQEGYDVQDLMLIQTFLGLAIAFGIVASGTTINKICQITNRKIYITIQHVCQISLTIVSITTLVLSAVIGYKSLCIIAWGYGIGLGGYRYSLKMFALERVRAKHFTKSWGFIKGVESIPVLIGVPLTAFLNDSSHRYGRAGYYICSAVTAISAILMFFIGYPSGGPANRQNLSKYSVNGSIISHCTTLPTNECPDLLNRSFSSGRCGGGGGGGYNWYSHSTPYTTMSNICTASNHQYNQQHQQQQQPQQHPNESQHCNHQHFQHPLNGQLTYMNGGIGYPMYHCYDGSKTIGHGRLQKSLSYAFQTPTMWNDCYHQTCWDNQSNQSNQYIANNLCYSRCDLHSTPITVNSMPYQQPSRSRSVPEGLAYAHNDTCQCMWNYRNRWTSNSFRHYPTTSTGGGGGGGASMSAAATSTTTRPIQVVEQITTSV